MLYVLNELSIGLHRSNLDSMMDIVEDLVRHGNSMVPVDHDTRILRRANWLIDIGLDAERSGSAVVSRAPLCRSLPI